MAIRNEMDRTHEILGVIRYDDGEYDLPVRCPDEGPYWIAQSCTRDAGPVDFMISDIDSAPDPVSLERAVRVFSSLEQIESASRDLIRPQLENGPKPEYDIGHYEADLMWVDCRLEEPVATFNWDAHLYVLWEATLNSANEIVTLKLENW